MKLLPKIALGLAFGMIGGLGTLLWGAPDEQVSEELRLANVAGVSITSDFRETMHDQALARGANDVIKLNCVNEKLVEMKGEMNIADKSYLQIKSSDSSDEQIERQTALDALTHSEGTIHELRGEADECVGAALLSTASANSYTHPLIPDNPTSDPSSGETSIEPPIYASPIN